MAYIVHMDDHVALTETEWRK